MYGPAMPRKKAPPALLFGPYRSPALKVGDRATCLYRPIATWS
jgi:hypothetical protein